MWMPISHSSHLYISLNLAHFEKLAKRFPTSSVLWIYINSLSIMKGRNYLKWNQSTGKIIWNLMHLQYGADLHSLLKCRSQFTARRLCKIKSTGMNYTSTVRNGITSHGSRKDLNTSHQSSLLLINSTILILLIYESFKLLQLAILWRALL
ncbi:hypothetical protein ICA_05807 [Bacillus cereus BAG1O-3]|nr:hypothetical protein ICE_05845 [Bacillus cereus BAG1X1-2]EJV74504.1 hypothetical protein IGE_05624 [Bacillus cereus HuB1-1]EPF08307.1 hypothetical protein ICA_05807 [Bacillus cereus BAG1O-3]PFG72788.1 hypothetical protein DL97_5913 [Bacillus sp. YF23]